MGLDKDFLSKLFEQAVTSPRLRQDFDLRTSPADTNQHMLNVLLPDTKVPIHQHENTTGTVIYPVSKLGEIIYEEVNEYVYEATSCCDDVMRQKKIKEISRQILSPAEGKLGIQIPAGTQYTISVIEPSVVFEAKGGAYNESGNTTDRK